MGIVVLRTRGFRSSETNSNVKHVKCLTKRLESVFTDVFFTSDKVEYLHPFYPPTADNPLFQQWKEGKGAADNTKPALTLEFVSLLRKPQYRAHHARMCAHDLAFRPASYQIPIVGGEAEVVGGAEMEGPLRLLVSGEVVLDGIAGGRAA